MMTTKRLQQARTPSGDGRSRRWRHHVEKTARSWSQLGSALAVIGLLGWGLAVGGCNLSSGELPGAENDGSDAGDNVGPTNQPIDPDAGDDASNQNSVVIDPSAATTFTFCAGGGVSTGEEYVLTHCTGPAELGGRVSEGDGLRLEVGAFEVLTTPSGQ